MVAYLDQTVRHLSSISTDVETLRQNQEREMKDRKRTRERQERLFANLAPASTRAGWALILTEQVTRTWIFKDSELRHGKWITSKGIIYS